MLRPIPEHVDVIEDDLEVRTLLKTILQGQGYSVQTHDSVESFLTGQTERHPRIILTDVHLPGQSGLELQELFIQTAQPTPFVLMSGGANAEVQAKALANGAIAFLLKPFPLEALLKAVTQAMTADKQNMINR
jgi:FixJ family two-component response regulator